MTDAKGQGKSVEELFPCPFFTGAETGQCKSNGSLYAARHLWEEAAKRLKGKTKGRKQKKVPKPCSFRTFAVMRDQFRCMLKIGKIESWSGFELFQPYFLLTISCDREESRDF
jgi:hypothetical protein